MGRRKGKEVEDGFNTQKKGVMGSRELKARMAALADEIKKKEEAKRAKNSEKNEENEVDDDTLGEIGLDRGSYKMLSDMRAVYKKAGGQKKLMELIKADDKLLMAMLKDLMKIEGSLMAAKLRGKDNGVGATQAVFVILKGLQTEAEVVGATDKTIDLTQVSEAINPLAAKKIEYEEEMVRPE